MARRRLWMCLALGLFPACKGPAADLSQARDASAQAYSDVPAPEDVAAIPENATTMESGLAFRVLAPGDGRTRPTFNDAAVLNYTGWTTDGRMFHSTGGVTATLPLSRLPDGWVDALLDMSKGERRRVWVPEQLGFNGQLGAPRGLTVLDFELVDVQPAVFRAVPPPADVSAVPDDAEVLPSGLASKVLRKGVSKERPNEMADVIVEYTGWRASNGRMFDSSSLTGKPSRFYLLRLVPGLSEGIQQMVPGEKRRFWIPESLAYKGARPPFGMLVFDVELIEFTNPDGKSIRVQQGLKVSAE